MNVCARSRNATVEQPRARLRGRCDLSKVFVVTCRDPRRIDTYHLSSLETQMFVQRKIDARRCLVEARVHAAICICRIPKFEFAEYREQVAPRKRQKLECSSSTRSLRPPSRLEEYGQLLKTG